MAAGGAAAAGPGAAYVATKNAGARAVGGSTAGQNTNLSEKSHSDLQAEVKRLQGQVDTLKKSATGQSADGIPIHIVAAICFGVFAFTYLFL